MEAGKRKIAPRGRYVWLIIPLCLLILILCHVCNKQAEVGAEVFRLYYLQKAEKDVLHDYSHMQLDELENMASSSQGIAVDTEELAIEVVGAIVSGNTAEIVLRVTAKRLDSVLRENGSNYCFMDYVTILINSLPGGGWEVMTPALSYNDAVASLAPNQFELHYCLLMFILLIIRLYQTATTK